MHLKNILLTASTVLMLILMSNTIASAQGCGTYIAYGSVQCLDYQNRSVSHNACNPHTAEIGSRPATPTASCPNTCCTETHTVDGVVQGTPEVKLAGTCNSTSRTTTCEERGDCPVVVAETCEDRGDCPVDPPETCEDRGDCPVDTCTETNTHDGVVTTVQKPEGTCNNTTTCTPRTTTEDKVEDEACTRPGYMRCGIPIYDDWNNPTGETGCRWVDTISNWVSTTGTQVVTSRRDVITSGNCSISYGEWAEVSRTGRCYHQGDRGIGE